MSPCKQEITKLSDLKQMFNAFQLALTWQMTLQCQASFALLESLTDETQLNGREPAQNGDPHTFQYSEYLMALASH